MLHRPPRRPKLLLTLGLTAALAAVVGVGVVLWHRRLEYFVLPRLMDDVVETWERAEGGMRLLPRPRRQGVLLGFDHCSAERAVRNALAAEMQFTALRPCSE